VAHPDKIAVGGHSYGAFMTANLLAHAPHLFCCGIARSGAYNRTLTPFGFQVQTNAVSIHGIDFESLVTTCFFYRTRIEHSGRQQTHMSR
jgi:predicted esterase